MTIEDILEVVMSETGKKVNQDTELKDLSLDSLEFLDLLIRVGNIPDSVVPRLNTVNDLYLAASGQL
jgi:acyl carrier protein